MLTLYSNLSGGLEHAEKNAIRATIINTMRFILLLLPMDPEFMVLTRRYVPNQIAGAGDSVTGNFSDDDHRR
jgi:hypothetical protein